METLESLYQPIFRALRSYPTYEEWKLIEFTIIPAVESTFLSYLWGMETFDFSLSTLFLQFGSYPTYEEWKLEAFKKFRRARL